MGRFVVAEATAARYPRGMATLGGTFSIGDLVVHRLGFGAMRITGPGIWGDPEDVAECRRVLARTRQLGIDFIDTADSYGPYVSEQLIGEMEGARGVIATKGGLVRHGPDIWLPVGRPEYLKQEVLMSMRRLRVKRIDLWQLHRIDPKVPRDEQFGIMAEMQRDGLIRHLGLSEVSVEEIEAASRHFRVVTVQNEYNLITRKSEDVLAHCEKKSIGFIPWYPMAGGVLARPGGVLDRVAQRLGATTSQVALAWLLQRSPVMLPIPGTAKVRHLEDNVKAADLTLTADDFRALDAAGKQESKRAATG
jgi:pyridoxine 4-dehydrogenase